MLPYSYPVPDYPYCFVTKDGRMFKECHNGVLEVAANRKPGVYPYTYSLHTDGTRRRLQAHIAIARTFIGIRPYDTVVAHLNGKKEDSRLENLAYVSVCENCAHKLIHANPDDEAYVIGICEAYNISPARLLDILDLARS